MKKSKRTTTTTEKLNIERVDGERKIGDTKRHGYVEKIKFIYTNIIAIGTLQLHLFFFIWSILLVFILFFCFSYLCAQIVSFVNERFTTKLYHLLCGVLCILSLSRSFCVFFMSTSRDEGEPCFFVAELFFLYTEINNSELLHIKHKLVQWLDTIQPAHLEANEKNERFKQFKAQLTSICFTKHYSGKVMNLNPICLYNSPTSNQMFATC